MNLLKYVCVLQIKHDGYKDRHDNPTINPKQL